MTAVPMNEILERASKLGKFLSKDPRCRQMAACRKAFDDDPENRQLLNDQEEQQHKMAMLEHQGKPVEPEDKRRLAELHEKVIASPVIKDLLKAQADYVELMTAVSHTIETEALGLEKTESAPMTDAPSA